jgi:hypothetical protein
MYHAIRVIQLSIKSLLTIHSGIETWGPIAALPMLQRLHARVPTNRGSMFSITRLERLLELEVNYGPIEFCDDDDFDAVVDPDHLCMPMVITRELVSIIAALDGRRTVCDRLSFGQYTPKCVLDRASARLIANQPSVAAAAAAAEDDDDCDETVWNDVHGD